MHKFRVQYEFYDSGYTVLHYYAYTCTYMNITKVCTCYYK